ncbi:DUF4153 domain-containing protein [Nocardia pseudobrasiliensis]|uniref:Uncharacterized protein DUF4173 n=1 Tax=Nocardia pseudobrasiliensis TaxID=45979 RepID=A0A370HYB4_9NOCA|nr:DUF4173 domain-containing protein [Nocardia pseudobrasiliensis]RDI63492.1 uncharacterized protein DUF4173 [Nocardia pseudobrasiliensis]
MPTEPDPTSDAEQTAEPAQQGDIESSTPAPVTNPPSSDPTAPQPANAPTESAPAPGNGSAWRSPDTVAAAPTDLAPRAPVMPNPPIRPRIPPRWTRVSFPRGVLSAMTISAVAGAAFIPLDSPGIGWFLAAATATTTLIAVDRTARRDRATDPTPATTDTAPKAASADSAAETAAAAPVSSADNSLRSHVVAAPEAASAGDSMSADKPESDSAARHDAASIGNPASDTAALPEAGAADSRAPSTAAALDVSSAASAPARHPAPGDIAALADVSADSAPRHPYRARWWWAALTLALLSVGVIRASGWLFTCCLFAAAATFSLTLVGRRSVSGIWFDIFAVPLSTLAMPPWLTRGVRRRTTGATAAQTRIAISLIVTAVLLLIFVPLLAGADAMFAGILRSVIPQIDGVTAVRWIIVGAITAALTGGSLYLLAGPPMPADARRATGGMHWRTMEWALPVGALTILFAIFVTVQLTALFGGDDYVQRTAGLTYAEYARSGFWQLSVVSILTLAVIAAVLRWAATDTPAQTLWLRTLPAVLGALTLVIVASALSRMWTYQQAYGFTVLRLLVSTCEIWIALLYLMILAALIRLRRAWLPRAAVGAAALTLLLLAATDPERLVADRNIDRWQAGKSLDTGYLSQLSADIAPAADRLPEPLRSQLLDPVRARTTDHRWQSWTLSRARLQ